MKIYSLIAKSIKILKMYIVFLKKLYFKKMFTDSELIMKYFYINNNYLNNN